MKKAMIAGAAATHISPGIWTGTGTITVADPGTNDNPNNSNKANGCTVLFQGDSITDGNRTRNLDWNHVLGHGYAYLISSRLWYTHTDKGLHFFNRGISGNKVTDLAARWQQDTLDIKPDVLSILVGVNDVDSMFIKDNPAAVPADRFEKEYHALLQQTKERLPDTMLVIMEPFILPVGKVRDNWKPGLQR